MPGVAAPDPAATETAQLPLLDLATHYPNVLEDAAAACGAGTREVVYLGFSESYPNYAFLRADDPNPADPAVFTTDHELFFREIDPEGSLSEYLEQMLTDDVVYRALRDQLD